ncbi:ATP-binding protein [Micromonospora sp. M12]
MGILEGEPGVGKTRLLEEAATMADQHGALVIWGRCLEGDGTPSMWPWEQALGAIVDSLPALEREKWLASELGNLLGPGSDAVRRFPTAAPVPALRAGCRPRQKRLGTTTDTPDPRRPAVGR